jgi:hypothetical protein
MSRLVLVVPAAFVSALVAYAWAVLQATAADLARLVG